MQLSTMQPTATVSPTRWRVTSLADRGDGADDLVAGDVRVAVPPQSLRAVCRSRMADAGVGDLDRDIVGAKGAALELHRPKRLVGRVGAPAFGGGRSVGGLEACSRVLRSWPSSSLLSCSFQYAPGLNKVRAVDHLAVDRKHACVGMCLERGDDCLGVRTSSADGREGGVDHRRPGPGGWRACR